MSKKNSSRPALLVMMVLLSGCASLMNGTRQKLNISSVPTGEKVTIDGEDKGTTPTTASLKRANEHLVTISLPGYAPYQLHLMRKLSGWVWGNILAGGLIGLAVDMSTGALYKLSPPQIETTLSQQNAAVINKNNVFVVLVRNAQPEWTKIGALSSEVSHD